MSHANTEDQLVEQPAKRLLAELGWHLAQSHPHLGPLPEGEEVRAWVEETGLFGRETKGEVVLVSRLRAALERLNPALLPEAITAAVDELTRDRLTLQRLAERAAHPHPASPILRTRTPASPILRTRTRASPILRTLTPASPNGRGGGRGGGGRGTKN